MYVDTYANNLSNPLEAQLRTINFMANSIDLKDFLFDELPNLLHENENKETIDKFRVNFD